ncbi:tropomyosin-1 [Galendromus occidentalis]|uniref:Tropomyosin-1 n=1 Tax=Galendromus occidentalis TaxID=34638 RepID=A0AAJ6W012_9ACAR|nr:tropomyosin-1 [Galendromus occidentalis]
MLMIFLGCSRHRLTVLQDEVEELRREVGQAVREKLEFSEKLNQANEEIENLKEDVTRKQDKLTKLRSQLEDLKLDRESRAGQLAEQDKRMRLLENLVKSGKTRVDRANKEKESLEKEFKKRLDECMLELKSANEKLAQLQPESASQSAEQQKNNQILGETCAKLVEDLEQTRQKLRESSLESENLRSILKHKVGVMEKIREDLTVFQGQGRKYAAERQTLLDTIHCLEEDIERKRKRDIELRNAMGLIAEKVIERLQTRHRVL